MEEDTPQLESVEPLHEVETIDHPPVRFLTREEILNASDYTTEIVEVPEWGGSVIVQSLSGKERDEFELSQLVQKGKVTELNLVNLRARLVAMSIVDENHKSVFTLADVAKLGAKNAAALERVYKVAQRLSGLRREDIEELTVALKGVQSDDSGSD
jgi:hypothetical protein